MTGQDFVYLLEEYMTNIGKEIHFGIIKDNPEQGKHLETIKVKILDLEIDLCNLRGCEYSNDNKFGTPEEDAFKRDFSMNSLFYNINQNKLEDFTNLGLIDLFLGVIRTPLQPKITFTDDPLRILRAIRFACRFSFRFDYDLMKAAQDPSIHLLFTSNVSRERIGVELQEIFENNVSFGMNSIISFKLFNEVFAYQNGQVCYDFSPYFKAIQESLKKFLIYSEKFQNIDKFKGILALIYSFINDYLEVVSVPNTSKKMSKCSAFAMTSLKYSTNVNQSITILLNGIEGFLNILPLCKNHSEANVIGIAEWIIQCGELWETVLLLASSKKMAAIEEIEFFMELVEMLRLREAYNIKPLVTGKMLIDMGFKPGKDMGNILKKILNYQFIHRDCTSAECIELARTLL
eukprot:TRINITY_DN9345_c0_g1_i1.p1 TRINITY_DN9345_c0_g1~~TRINITY_DN9345_c0_g1_i1.p1  ORF type:complete len:473 (+),score=120.43 TRINITY_DN9345_c0_g1_i1:209-1420(+)